VNCDQAFHGVGACVDSFPMLLGICIAVTTIVLAAAWKEIRDVIADIRAEHARKQLKLISSRHR